jgi:hypothetical protein
MSFAPPFASHRMCAAYPSRAAPHSRPRRPARLHLLFFAPRLPLYCSCPDSCTKSTAFTLLTKWAGHSATTPPRARETCRKQAAGYITTCSARATQAAAMLGPVIRLHEWCTRRRGPSPPQGYSPGAHAVRGPNVNNTAKKPSPHTFAHAMHQRKHAHACAHVQYHWMGHWHVNVGAGREVNGVPDALGHTHAKPHKHRCTAVLSHRSASLEHYSHSHWQWAGRGGEGWQEGATNGGKCTL